MKKSGVKINRKSPKKFGNRRIMATFFASVVVLSVLLNAIYGMVGNIAKLAKSENETCNAAALINDVVEIAKVPAQIKIVPNENVTHVKPLETKYIPRITLDTSSIDGVIAYFKQEGLIIDNNDSSKIMFNIRDFDKSTDFEILCRIVNAETATSTKQQMINNVHLILARKVYGEHHIMFPKTIKEIVSQKGQFNCILGGEYNFGNNRFYEPYSIEVAKVVVEALNSPNSQIGGAVAYTSPFDYDDLKSYEGTAVIRTCNTTEYIGFTDEFLMENFGITNQAMGFPPIA